METLYFYQRLVKQLIQSGQSVILQAPTGAGKTRAALAPFIEAFFDFPAEQFPKKCIYSVPMRVLANQFEAEYGKFAQQYKTVFGREIQVSIQTGEHPEDPKLEGDLIFTTIDQTLSNFLCIPYALGNGSSNLNAGAIVSSYLVFDEFHLFPPQALATTLAMLKMLKGITPFLLMTATFSEKMLVTLSRELDAVVIPQPAERHEFQALPSQRKERVYHTVDGLLTPEAVLQHHPAQGRSIAICNTVKRAQALYDGIIKAEKPAGTEVILLHSQFFKEDRSEKENWLQREFGKKKSDYTAKSAILVATQVVEVGLDITSGSLHTELAPANAILQRAGRCARYENEKGNVYIYRLPEKEDKDGMPKPQYAPYHTHGQVVICEDTWTAFAAVTGTSLTFVDEQSLISTVHNPSDAVMLQKLADSHQTHKEMMQSAMGYHERGLSSELIREVNNYTVIVHPNPNTDTEENNPSRLKSPWRWQGFSMFKGSVLGAFKEVQALAEAIGHDDWLMMRLDQHEDPEEWGKNRTAYQWKAVCEAKQLEGTLMVAVHPRLASYSKECGFQLAVANDHEWCVPLRKQSGNRDDPRFSYKQETYQEHIAGLYRAYRHPWLDPKEGVTRQALADDMTYVFDKLEKRLNLTPGMLDELARLAIAGHDLGKLTAGWQGWVHRWQVLINRPVPAEKMLAHTDYDGSPNQDKLQKKLSKEIGPRPSHAAESAYGLLPLSAGQTGKDPNLVSILTTTIARHHAATHQGMVQVFKIDPNGQPAFEEAMALVGLTLKETVIFREPTDKKETSIIRYLAQPEKTVTQMLPYLMLVRLLRLADQRSQQQ